MKHLPVKVVLQQQGKYTASLKWLYQKLYCWTLADPHVLADVESITLALIFCFKE